MCGVGRTVRAEWADRYPGYLRAGGCVLSTLPEALGMLGPDETEAREAAVVERVTGGKARVSAATLPDLSVTRRTDSNGPTLASARHGTGRDRFQLARAGGPKSVYRGGGKSI